MKIINRVIIATIASFVCAPVAFSAPQPAVATLLDVQGKAFIESAEGVRQVARKGMIMGEGSNLLVLEKTKVQMSYAASGCKVSHGADTLVAVLESAQCAPGQQMSVGAGAASASSAAGATTTTIGAGVAGAATTTVASTTAAVTSSIASALGVSTAVATTVAVGAVAVGAAGVIQSVSDNNGSGGTVSP